MARDVIVPPRTDDPYEVRKFYLSICQVINNLVNAIPADSTASNVAEVVSDLNDLQDAIKDITAQ
jgi:hypothetical protein